MSHRSAPTGPVICDADHVSFAIKGTNGTRTRIRGIGRNTLRFLVFLSRTTGSPPVVLVSRFPGSGRERKVQIRPGRASRPVGPPLESQARRTGVLAWCGPASRPRTRPGWAACRPMRMHVNVEGDHGRQGCWRRRRSCTDDHVCRFCRSLHPNPCRRLHRSAGPAGGVPTLERVHCAIRTRCTSRQPRG